LWGQSRDPAERVPTCPSPLPGTHCFPSWFKEKVLASRRRGGKSVYRGILLASQIISASAQIQRQPFICILYNSYMTKNKEENIPICSQKKLL